MLRFTRRRAALLFLVIIRCTLRRILLYAFAPAAAAALPALRRIYSPSYFTPFPLYGSGGRNDRIFAATCPTSCLSMPLMTMFVGIGVSSLMPEGGSNRIGCE